MADRPAGLNVNNNDVLGVDQIFCGVGEEGVALVGASPRRCRIRWRHELGLYLAGGTEGRIIQRCRILANGPPRIGIEATGRH